MKRFLLFLILTLIPGICFGGDIVKKSDIEGIGLSKTIQPIEMDSDGSKTANITFFGVVNQSFCKDNDTKCPKQTYVWQTGEWENFDAIKCTAERDVYCKNIEINELVSDSKCESKKPLNHVQYQVPCNTDGESQPSTGYVWHGTKETSCRYVSSSLQKCTSYECVDLETGSIVESNNCVGEKPVDSCSPCATLDGSYQWRSGEWGESESDVCSRLVECVDTSAFEVVDSENCDSATKPEPEKACLLSGSYEWRNVSHSCEPVPGMNGLYSYSKQSCFDTNGNFMVDGGLCSSASSETPTYTACTILEPIKAYGSWSSAEWTSCIKDTTQGVQQEWGDQAVLDEDCFAEFGDTEACTYYDWVALDTYAVGSQIRKYFCINNSTGEKMDNYYCTDMIPSESKTCRLHGASMCAIEINPF